MELAGNIIIYVGAIFIAFGVAGIYIFKNFYTRLLISAKIDTIGIITVIIGVAVKHGLGFFSLKTILLMGIILVINPLATHMVARSAWLSGYQTDAKDKSEKNDYSEDNV